MKISKTRLGEGHPSTLTNMSNLAYTLRPLGQFGAALQLMTEWARLRGQILGPDHPDTMSSTSTLNDWSDIDSLLCKTIPNRLLFSLQLEALTGVSCLNFSRMTWAFMDAFRCAE